MCSYSIRGKEKSCCRRRIPRNALADEITLFDSTGMALQDVAAAITIYEKAIATGSGTRISFAV